MTFKMNAYIPSKKKQTSVFDIHSIFYRVQRIRNERKEGKELKGGIYLYISSPIMTFFSSKKNLVIKLVFDNNGVLQENETEYFFQNIEVDKKVIYTDNCRITDANHRAFKFLYNLLYIKFDDSIATFLTIVQSVLYERFKLDLSIDVETYDKEMKDIKAKFKSNLLTKVQNKNQKKIAA